MKIEKSYLLENFNDQQWLKVGDKVIFKQNKQSLDEVGEVLDITLLSNPKDTQSTDGTDVDKVMWYDKKRIIVNLKITNFSGEIKGKWAYGEQIYPMTEESDS